MRVRETITDTRANIAWETRRRSNNSLVATETTKQGMYRVKRIEDVEVPNFRALQKCGEFLPLNPVVINTVEDIHVPGVGAFDCTAASLKYAGKWCLEPPVGFFPPIDGVPEWDDDLVEAAVLAARANASSEKWDFLTFLAELRGTIDTMSDVARLFNGRTKQLAVEAAAFKKNPWKRFRELWLGARYSIRPLVYDFRDAYSALQKLLDDSALIRGSGKQETESEDVIPGAWATYGGYLDAAQTRFTVEKRTYRARAYIETENLLGDVLLADPLVTAWELIPYSFVVDWFVNIGAFVQTLGPTMRGDFVGTCYSVKEELSYRYEHRLKPNATFAAYTTGSFSNSDRSRVFTRYTRVPYTGLPFPSVLPRITLPKLIDLVALFVKGRNDVTRIMQRR